MDYEKLYKEALERAKKQLEGANVFDYKEGQIAHDIRTTTYAIFPELKESESEKVRKELIDFVKSRLAGFPQCEKYIAWLEKQGEQKPADKVEPKFHEGDWVVFNNGHQSIYQVEKIEDGYYILRHTHGGTFRVCVLHDESLRLWTIQDAEAGDVLVCEDFGYTSLMLFKSFSNGRISLHCWHNSQTNNFHINPDIALRKDANIYPATKEQRDLLFQRMKETGYEWDAEKKELKKIEQKSADLKTKAGNWYTCDMEIINENMKAAFHRNESYYCPKDGYLDVSGALFEVGDLDVFRLATEKEIPQSKQKTAWSEEDERKINGISMVLESWDSYHVSSAGLPSLVPEYISWLKSLKDKVQPKQEWSEEDKKKLDKIYSILGQAADTHAFSTTCRLIGDKECIELQDFLKSLIPQTTWKPSDEQMLAINTAINVLGKRTLNGKQLIELRDQLKKLI